VKWSVEVRGIVLLNEATGVVRSLEYPQAAIWDLITRGYSFEKTKRLVSAITSLGPEAARELIVASLERWTDDGFLTKGRD
jgi:hypothetical protein